MKDDIKTYLSTAPVLAILLLIFLASLLIEINRFFPDGLAFTFPTSFNFFDFVQFFSNFLVQ
uniref:Photosystem I reaction center subunit IX n=2 Tax=Tsuga diversifolia TaxID=85622 RepID=A0A411IJY9_9CONI|nr:photosystem I subunit IX [Tsuga diversifolia]QBB88726.1 photosystem I subunit IX [Tsuga diversifolia]WNV61287.1 photosystem I subunit IX [Tsuga diversifolia]WNV61658.1 photosystem I subunit IX [Tsuga diversifolia]WNV61730.1 photosystem I subunit IX [Tsuga diversifolia]